MTSDASSFAAYRDRSHFRCLDGLRFLCIAMVLWHHAQPVRSPALQILDRGFLGVDFFFVLSGFLITTLLLRERDRRGRFSLKNFYIRRALRILPVYGFVVTALCVYYIGIKGQTQYLEAVPFYYLFLSNFLVEHVPTLSITWSLSVEEQYYLIWPLLLMLLPSRLWGPVALGLVALNVGLAMMPPADPPLAAGPLVFRLPNATYAPIILGSLAAILLHRPISYARLRPLCAHPATPLAGFAALALLLQFGPEDVRGLQNLAIHLLMTLVLMALVVREHGALQDLLARRPLIRIGQVSYGIYLYHLIALDLTLRLGARLGLAGDSSDTGLMWLLLGSYSLLSWAMAELSFRTLEAFFRRFRPQDRPPKTVAEEKDPRRPKRSEGPTGKQVTR